MNAQQTMFTSQHKLSAGFADVTHQSQRMFRQILSAMAEPGTIMTTGAIESPPPISAATYQVCLALLDQETPVWIQPELFSSEVSSSLRFHCGCRLVEDATQAAFVLMTSSGDGRLDAFNQGSFEFPDRSATVIVEVESLADNGELNLEGPGIRGSRTVGIGGFDHGWVERLTRNRAAFPCGVDLILTCGNRLMALPRTTRLSHATMEV